MSRLTCVARCRRTSIMIEMDFRECEMDHTREDSNPRAGLHYEPCRLRRNAVSALPVGSSEVPPA
jgi:hypothetical protein